MMNTNSDVLLDVKQLVKYYPIKGGIFLRTINHVKAVDDISFQILKGETFGLVGESGCGKSTLGRVLIGLQKPTAGEVKFEEKDIFETTSKEKKLLKQQMQIIFQDPQASLNPRMTVEEIISQGMIIHKMYPKGEINYKVKELIEKVGLKKEYLHRYPHEFSGGQRQRIGIARALAINPKFIVCDEPVSALDVSVQAQILNLLKELQDEFGLTYLFIAHGLNVVKYLSTRIAVMYLGKIVEIAYAEELFDKPIHPYTQALISAIPKLNTNQKKYNSIVLEGDVPSPISPPSGCRFHTRCPYCKDICKHQEPKLKEDDKGHYIACHLFPV